MESCYFIVEVERAKHGNEQSMLNLLERFNPILQKYADALSYDDGYADLRYEFLALIKTFPPTKNFVNDGAVVSYIQKAIIHSFNRLRKKRVADKKVILHNELTEEQLKIIENQSGTIDDYSEIHIDSFKNTLTKTEYKVLHRHFILNLSIAEIACQDKLSRQTVNQTKNRALRKLRRFSE